MSQQGVDQEEVFWTDTSGTGCSAQDAAWIEVIRKMDDTYADLVRYQVELEEKNSALEEAQQFITSVLASMTDVLIVCDAKGSIQQVNHALEQLVGEAETALLGRPVQSLFSPDSQQKMGRMLEQIGAGAVTDCEFSLCGCQEDVPLTMNCTSRHDQRGRFVGIVLIGRPVGELRKAYHDLHSAHVELQQAQQQLVNAEKMASLGRLVAGVAHELNNPISFIYGNIHALDRYRERLSRYLLAVERAELPLQVEEEREKLRIPHILKDLQSLIDGTLQGAERVRDLVQDLRQFSSGQQGEHVRFDLVHVVRTAVHWVTREARADLAVDVKTPDTLDLCGLPGQIQQVLMNLVQNALDAVRELDSPRIEVRVTADDSWARIRVRDNGPGIGADELPQVFEPFFTTKPVGEGTGLGLSISYGIVNEHGGKLSVVNDPAGGAVFTMQMPRPTP